MRLWGLSPWLWQDEGVLNEAEMGDNKQKIEQQKEKKNSNRENSSYIRTTLSVVSAIVEIKLGDVIECD